MAPLQPVYCSNPLCPEVRATRRPELVGKASPGAIVELRCRKCKEVRLYRVKAEAGVL